MLLGRRVSPGPATTLIPTFLTPTASNTKIRMSGPRPFSTDMESFREHLKSSDRILALLGAGLSAASGLPTFRGAGGLWRNHDAVVLATPEAFDADPALVWQFYSYRRHMALNAKPNPAHRALAELAKRNKHFVTLSQNVDGLSPRAGHPAEQLYLLHGSLFDLKCSGFYCKHFERDNFTDPIVPALAIPTTAPEPLPTTGTDGSGAADALMAAMRHQGQELDISSADVPLAPIQPEELPRCPKCFNLLRPGVVWFGESLPTDVVDAVDQFIDDSDAIDLILVIGTSAKVYPAAGYVDIARDKGARVAVVNMDHSDIPGGPGGLTDKDWFFEGDAGALVPEMLKPVIGEI